MNTTNYKQLGKLCYLRGLEYTTKDERRLVKLIGAKYVIFITKGCFEIGLKKYRKVGVGYLVEDEEQIMLNYNIGVVQSYYAKG